MPDYKSATSTPSPMEGLLSDLFHKGEDLLRPQWEKVEKEVRQSPTASVLIAAGVGYMLHRLPMRSLLATNLKLLWAFAPPAVLLVAAAKGLQGIEGFLQPNDEASSQGAKRKRTAVESSSGR